MDNNNIAENSTDKHGSSKNYRIENFTFQILLSREKMAFSTFPRNKKTTESKWAKLSSRNNSAHIIKH